MSSTLLTTLARSHFHLNATKFSKHETHQLNSHKEHNVTYLCVKSSIKKAYMRVSTDCIKELMNCYIWLKLRIQKYSLNTVNIEVLEKSSRVSCLPPFCVCELDVS